MPMSGVANMLPFCRRPLGVVARPLYAARMDASNGFTPATFHREPGVDDWRVTSWGPQVCYPTSSLAAAAELVPAIIEAARAHGVEPDIDLRPEAIVVRVPYRGADHIPAGAAAFAAAVSATAAERGLHADLHRIQTVDIMVVQSGVDTRPFWTAALGYDVSGDTDAVDPLRRGPALSFSDIDKPGRGRTHIDVSVPADLAEARVAAALDAGGRLVDDSYAPKWWTLASPDNHGIDIAAWTDTFGDD
jgi:4a-hydroxytetrahydrobiopterin dehydratase